MPTPDMRRLSETPPRCPECDSLLPGILTQRDLATFAWVRCYQHCVWFRPDVPLALQLEVMANVQRAKAREERSLRALEQE